MNIKIAELEQEMARSLSSSSLMGRRQQQPQQHQQHQHGDEYEKIKVENQQLRDSIRQVKK